MNLAEWNAMSPEEQKETWEELSAFDKCKISAAEESPKRFKCCSPEITSTRDWLRNQIPDELDASRSYRQAADALDIADTGEVQELMEMNLYLHKMANEEYGHYLADIAFVALLDQMCDCDKE